MSERAERGSIPDAILAVLAEADHPMTPSEIDAAIPDGIEHSLSGVKSACIRMAGPKKRQIYNHDGAYSLNPPGHVIRPAREAPTSTPARSVAVSDGVHLVELVGPLGVIARFTVHMEQVGSPVQIGVSTPELAAS